METHTYIQMYIIQQKKLKMEEADKDKIEDDTKPNTNPDSSPKKTTVDATVTTPDKPAVPMDTSVTKSTPGAFHCI